MVFKVGILASHPIQYQAPLFRELARLCNLHVFFAHQQTAQAQAAAGFGVAFEWDVDLLSGYTHTFLPNVAKHPDAGAFMGCDTPDIAKQISSGKFDAFLVTGWHLKAYWQAISACHRNNVPVIVRGDSQLGTPRSWFKQAAKRLIYPWVIRQFDGCLHVGQRNREYLEYYGAPARSLFFAPHCVDILAFSESAAAVNRSEVRAGWGLQPQDHAVLFVGKLLARKRPDDLVRAAAQLVKQGKPVVLVWAGDGPARQSLLELGALLHVPMVFLGFCNQSQLPAVYRAADVLALPSEGSETWGLVVNEAMACGTPCVVSNASGCAPDMVLRGVTGEVFAMGQVDALALALSRALMIERDTRQIAAHSARYSVTATASGVLAAVATLKKNKKP